MSKLDEAKERLGLLKFWLGIFISLFISISFWLVTNYNKSSILFVFSFIIIVIVLIIAILIINNKIEKKLKDIRDL